LLEDVRDFDNDAILVEGKSLENKVESKSDGGSVGFEAGAASSDQHAGRCAKWVKVNIK
jgi:hypothetical protein